MVSARIAKIFDHRHLRLNSNLTLFKNKYEVYMKEILIGTNFYAHFTAALKNSYSQF